jgi:ribonuclease P protein component|nr:ribonuclease P protein component [Butyrivibrio sp. Su6]
MMLFSESMKKTNDFLNVYRNGKSYADKNIVIYVWKNEGSRNKLGISCSKKVGNSVVRHRFARLVRESYRLHEDIFNSGLDIVVVARACAKDANFFDIEKSVLSLAGKARIMKNGGDL